MRANAQGCPRLLNLPAFAEQEKRDLLASATLVAQPSRVEYASEHVGVVTTLNGAS